MNGPGSSILIWMRPNMRRDLAPKGAAAIGGAAAIPGSGPLGGVHQSPELRAPIRNTADGAVSAEPLFLAEFCNTPMAGAI